MVASWQKLKVLSNCLGHARGPRPNYVSTGRLLPLGLRPGLQQLAAPFKLPPRWPATRTVLL